MITYQSVGQVLQLVSREAIFIDQNLVMRRTRSALDASMGAQKEIKIAGVHHRRIDDSSRRHVAALANSIGAGEIIWFEINEKPQMVARLYSPVIGNESRMVTLLDNDESELRLVRRLVLGQHVLNQAHFFIVDSAELAFGDAITIEDDSFRQDLVLDLIGRQHVDEHFVQFLDDFLTEVSLNGHRATIASEIEIAIGNHCGQRWTAGFKGT